MVGLLAVCDRREIPRERIHHRPIRHLPFAAYQLSARCRPDVRRRIAGSSLYEFCRSRRLDENERRIGERNLATVRRRIRKCSSNFIWRSALFIRPAEVSKQRGEPPCLSRRFNAARGHDADIERNFKTSFRKIIARQHSVGFQLHQPNGDDSCARRKAHPTGGCSAN